MSRRSRQTHEEHVRREQELELLAQEGEPAPLTGPTGPSGGGEERERSVAAQEAEQEERRAREREHGHDQPWVPTSGLVDRARRNPRRQ